MPYSYDDFIVNTNGFTSIHKDTLDDLKKLADNISDNASVKISEIQDSDIPNKEKEKRKSNLAGFKAGFEKNNSTNISIDEIDLRSTQDVEEKYVMVRE